MRSGTESVSQQRRLMLIELPIQVSGYDIDVMGIVSNIVYVRWFEDLRWQFLEKYYPFEDIYRSGLSPILSHTEVEYKAPLTVFDAPVGRCWVTALRKSRWEMAFELEVNGKIHTTGRQCGYFFDLERKRPARIPQRLLSAFEQEGGVLG